MAPLPKQNARRVLADNIAAMREAKPQGGQRAWAKRIGIGEATLIRMVKGDSDVQMSSVQAVAEGFGLQLWQILVPGLDPANLPVYISHGEQRLYKRWKARAVEDAEAIVGAKVLPPAD